MIGNWQPYRTFSNLLRQVMGQSDNYETLTSEKALTYPAVWYGVNKIAGHIAQLPVVVYKRLERGAEPERMHPIQQLVRKPNAYQTASVHREQIATQSLLEGNGRAAIVREGNMITELIPLLPDYTATGMLLGEKMHATRPPVDDRLRLFFDPIDPKDNEGVIALDDDQVVHIPGLSLDGVVGLPLIEAAKRNLLISLGTEKRLSAQMTHGFQGNIMLNAPPGVFRRQEDAMEFLEWFEKQHHSTDKAGKPGLLREGITAQVLAMNNTDAQFIDQRMFQRQDAALWLGLEQILGDDTSVSYNSLEQKNLAYLMNTLNKWLKRWEEEMEVKLLTEKHFRTGKYFIRFNTGALLKSDYKTSIESLSQAIISTIMSPNEARAVIDMNPREGGDVYANPSIYVPENDEGVQPKPGDEPAPDESQAAKAIRSRLENLIKVEANRVSAATKNGKPFVDWVDGFYESWEVKLSVWFSEMDLPTSLAVLHCEASKAQLVEFIITSTPETLADSVAACVSGWPDRAADIMESSYVCV